MNEKIEFNPIAENYENDEKFCNIIKGFLQECRKNWLNQDEKQNYNSVEVQIESYLEPDVYKKIDSEEYDIEGLVILKTQKMIHCRIGNADIYITGRAFDEVMRLAGGNEIENE